MKQEKTNEIWTIGHSTHTLDELIIMLQSFNIQMLADIRSYPGSKRYPHFNKQNLEVILPQRDIKYIHLPGLGGRRKPDPDSHNNAWHNMAFRGYADYMETTEFKKSINELIQIATFNATAYMCSEAVWWRCHRSLVSDYLKAPGWKVIHISGINKSEEHPYTQVAKVNQGNLFY